MNVNVLINCKLICVVILICAKFVTAVYQSNKMAHVGMEGAGLLGISGADRLGIPGAVRMG